MTAVFIGRKFNVGIGKESSRGTAVAATYWIPKMDFKHDDKIDVVVDETSVGVIEDSQGQDTVFKSSEGELSGRITDTSFGLWLMALMGTDTTTLVSTPTTDHTFTVLESAQHPTLTVCMNEPNATGASSNRYALTVVDNMEFNFEIGQYATYKVGWRGNVASTGTNTPTYTAENPFMPQHGVFQYASTYSGLSSPTSVSIKKATFKVSKNIEDDQVIGNLAAADRYNKHFVVEGSVELLYTDRTFIDTIMLGGLSKAMRLKFTNTDVSIAGASNPTLTFDFAKVQFKEIARDISNTNIVRQTLNFKAYYSLSDALMFKAILRNTVTAAY